MKNSKVAQLCKASRDIVLVSIAEDGRKPVQWVGTMQAVYPLTGMPTMNKAQIYAMFDVTDKQEGKIRFTETTAEKIGFNLGEADDSEEMIEPRGIHIVYGGCVFVPFDTSKGMRLVDRAYLTAMAKDIDFLSFYERQTEGGKIYIVARIGLLLAGVIGPQYNAGGDKHVVEFARWFERRMDIAQRFAEAERVAKDTSSGDEQLTLVNIETGEILDDATGERDTDETRNHADVVAFPAEPTEQTDKLNLKLRDDDDGGDAA